MNPNHYLAVAIRYLFAHRPGWPAHGRHRQDAGVSALIDRVARGLGRQLFEVPVGFKWFVEGLDRGALGFGGEESAGASFLRKDGTVWTTDKDGLCWRCWRRRSPHARARIRASTTARSSRPSASRSTRASTRRRRRRRRRGSSSCRPPT